MLLTLVSLLHEIKDQDDSLPVQRTGAKPSEENKGGIDLKG